MLYCEGRRYHLYHGFGYFYFIQLGKSSSKWIDGLSDESFTVVAHLDDVLTTANAQDLNKLLLIQEQLSL